MTDTADAHSIIGSALADNINGAGGNDYIYGYGGSDILTGGTGQDYLYGGTGNDIYGFQPGSGADVISDESGADLIIMNSIMPENLVFSSNGYDLTITSTLAATDTLTITSETYTGSTDQQVEAMQFNDGFSLPINSYAGWIIGTAGNDALYGDATPGRADVMLGGNGNDTIKGYNGNDIIEGGAGADSLYGGVGNDILHGGSGNDTLTGEAGADTLLGRQRRQQPERRHRG
jgi:Ca2+-binding RTX toxin-like protein